MFSILAYVGRCCRTDLGAFQQYTMPSEQCCEGNQLKLAGTCSTEEGIKYYGRVQMYTAT